jgi:hypothetical protein
MVKFLSFLKEWKRPAYLKSDFHKVSTFIEFVMKLIKLESLFRMENKIENSS